MKTRRILFAAFLAVLTILLISHLQRTSSQDEGDDKTEGSFGGGGFGGGEGWRNPKEPIWADPVMVWSTVYFIQLDKKDMDAVEKKIGFSLDPSTGKPYLDAKERKKLMDALDEAPSIEYLGSASTVTISGQQAQTQLVEEVRYPTDFVKPESKSEEASGDAADQYIVPADFETRETGILYTFTPTIAADGKLITMVLFPEASCFNGWVNFGTMQVPQPVFTSLNTNAIWYMEDGSTIVLKNIPAKAFVESYVMDPALKTKKRETKVNLIICTVKLVVVGEAKED